MVTCPECDADIGIPEDDLDDMEPGDRWECGECGSQLRLLSVDPPEFEPDDDDDDEDDEDESDDSSTDDERYPDTETEDESLDDVDEDNDDEDDEWD